MFDDLLIVPEGFRTDRAWIAVSTVELLALTVWIGGLVTIIGAVIPAAFNVGMETGGQLLTRVFAGYNRLVGVAIAVLVAAGLMRIWGGRRWGLAWSPGRAELGVFGVMLALYGAIVLWLGPQAVALQQEAFAATGPEAKRAAYEAFFAAHRIVRALYLVNLVLGISVLTLKVARLVNR